MHVRVILSIIEGPCVLCMYVSIYVCVYVWSRRVSPCPQFFFVAVSSPSVRSWVAACSAMRCVWQQHDGSRQPSRLCLPCMYCFTWSWYMYSPAMVSRGEWRGSGVEWRGEDQTEHVHTCDKFKIIYMTRKSTGTQEQLEQEGKKERKKFNRYMYT